MTIKPDKIALLILSFVFLTASDSYAQVQTKIDSNGRTVFFNIPPKKTPPVGPLFFSKRSEEFISTIEHISGQYGVDAKLVKAMIQVESSFNPRAISPKGASGLMQLMPQTALRYGVRQIFDPKENIEGGVKYIKDLLRLFNSDLQLVVASYNAGEGIVRRLNRIPNYEETQNYVRKVLALYKGDANFSLPTSKKPRLITYYKYVDPNGVTQYSLTPVTSAQVEKVSFYY